ncbi:hypothetical protein Mame01_21260 [Microbispora amethystogenes]|nr:hypothetical protein Mame01_21260 [Microbispora amethystogenes]
MQLLRPIPPVMAVPELRDVVARLDDRRDGQDEITLASLEQQLFRDLPLMPIPR